MVIFQSRFRSAGAARALISFAATTAGFTGIALSAVYASNAEAASAWNWKPKFDNKLSLAPAYYPDDLKQNTSQYSSAVRFEPELQFKFRKGFKLRLAPYLYSDSQSTSEREKFFLDANEANIEIKPGDFTFKLGLNQVSWGATDVFNPLDVVSARRYFDPLNSEKRSVPSFIASYDTGTWRFEGIYVPVQLESILPGENSRWLPRDVTYDRSRSNLGRIELPPDLRYSYLPNNVIEDALKNNYGARIEYHASGLDLSLIHFFGSATAPSILPNAIADITRIDPIEARFEPDVKLEPFYYARRTTGASIVWSLETAIIRFAAAASDSAVHRSILPGWSQNYVLGLEKNFAVMASTLTVLLQGTYGVHEDSPDNTVTSADRIFDQSMLLGLRLTTSNDVVINLASLYENVNKGVYVQLKGETKLKDGWTAFLLGELIDAPSGTPLGTYRRNDRITLGTTVYW